VRIKLFKFQGTAPTAVNEIMTGLQKEKNYIFTVNTYSTYIMQFGNDDRSSF
jgi:hypothetical protein